MRKHNSRKKRIAQKRYNARKNLGKKSLKNEEIVHSFWEDIKQAFKERNSEIPLDMKHTRIWYIRKCIDYASLVIFLLIALYIITSIPMSRDSAVWYTR